MKRTGRRAVFLDRDGTIIYDLGYPRDPEQVQLLPGVAEALSLLRGEGFYLVLVSNQSGVGRGLLTVEDVKRVHDRLVALLAKYAVQFDGAYYCPHAPWEESTCRKPSPGMLLRAAKELKIDLARSFIVGDRLEDIEAGKRTGCRTILINIPSSPRSLSTTPNYFATDWLSVVQYIIKSPQSIKESR